MLTIDPSLHRTPQRVVCLVPSLTEAFFAFRLEDTYGADEEDGQYALQTGTRVS